MWAKAAGSPRKNECLSMHAWFLFWGEGGWREQKKSLLFVDRNHLRVLPIMLLNHSWEWSRQSALAFSQSSLHKTYFTDTSTPVIDLSKHHIIPWIPTEL